MSVALALASMAMAGAAVLGAMLIAVRSPGWRGWVLLWLTLGCFGAGVMAPLWRLTHTSAEPTREVLNARRRDVTMPAAPRTATYRLDIQGAGRSPGTYTLAVKRGEDTQTIDGRLDGDSSIFEAALAEGEELRLFLVRSDGGLAVTMAEQPRAPTGTWVLAVAAALFAVAADLYGATRRRRGLLTLAVAAASIFTIAVARVDASSRATIAGLVLAAVLGGAAFAVVTQLIAASVFRGLADERTHAGSAARRSRRS